VARRREASRGIARRGGGPRGRGEREAAAAAQALPRARVRLADAPKMSRTPMVEIFSLAAEASAPMPASAWLILLMSQSNSLPYSALVVASRASPALLMEYRA